MARVYLETSFLSACVSIRRDAGSFFRREVSRRWWVQQRHRHTLFVSAEVIQELSAPGHRNRDDALALTIETLALPLDDRVLDIAKILVQEKVMPGPEGSGDAIHVAIAIVNGMDAILSWNVRHLANRNKVVHLRETCGRIGMAVPEIVTPDAYWTLDDDEDR